MITIPSVRGVATRSPMTEEVVVTTTRSAGTFVINVQLTVDASTISSNRVTVLWWDGTKSTQSYIAGFSPEYDVQTGLASGVPYSFSKAISSPYNNSNPKTVRLYTSNSSGKAIGHYNKNYRITHVDVADSAVFQDNGVTSVDVSGLRSLLSLTTSLNAGLTSLPRLPKTLTTLFVDNCNLTSIDLTGQTALEALDIYNNSNLTSLGLSTCTSLLRLNCFGTGISSLNLNGLSNLTLVKCMGCPNLTSIRAVGVGGAMGTYNSYSTYSYFFSGINVAGCNLSGAGLNQLYTDLSNVGFGTAYIIVQSQNPAQGELNDTPSIATNKGYTVLGT